MERAGAAGGGAGNLPPAPPRPAGACALYAAHRSARGTKVAADRSAKSGLSEPGARAIFWKRSQEIGESGMFSQPHSGGDTSRRKLRCHPTASRTSSLSPSPTCLVLWLHLNHLGPLPPACPTLRLRRLNHSCCQSPRAWWPPWCLNTMKQISWLLL